MWFFFHLVVVLVCLDWPHQNEINVFPFEGGNSNRINSLHSSWFDSVVVWRSSLKGGVIPAQLQCGLKCKVPLALPVLLKGPDQGKEINAGKQSLPGRKVLCQMGVKSCRRKVNSDVPTDFREASRELALLGLFGLPAPSLRHWGKPGYCHGVLLGHHNESFDFWTLPVTSIHWVAGIELGPVADSSG